MTNQEIVKILREMAELYEMEGVMFKPRVSIFILSPIKQPKIQALDFLYQRSIIEAVL